MIPIVAIVGPTGSGKTALGIEVAERLDTEIISADSMQCYRGMAIGTGAPSAEELARVKHHFVGCYDLRTRVTAADFAERARTVVEGINARGKPAVVVGGSGLYVRALIDGLFEGPGGDDALREELAQRAEREGIEPLYARLQQVDSAYAGRIAATDLRRIVRALEVYEQTGRPFSELHAETGADGFEAVQFALDYPRDVLYGRINRRVDAMLEAGLLDEVRELLDAGYAEEIDRLRSLGYRELAAHLRGEVSLAEAVEQMKMLSRRYAKRQLTWFRADSRIKWIDMNAFETITSQADAVLDAMSGKV